MSLKGYIVAPSLRAAKEAALIDFELRTASVDCWLDDDNNQFEFLYSASMLMNVPRGTPVYIVYASGLKEADYEYLKKEEEAGEIVIVGQT